jgi:hypothetical protein
MNPRLLRPTASGFNPKSLSGLIAWYDASDASTITTDTGVSEWRDKSGLGRKLEQSSGSNQPALLTNGIGGKPALGFTASSTHFMRGTFSQTLSAATAFLVARMGSATSSNGRIWSLEVTGQVVDFGGTGHLVLCKRNGANNAVDSYHDDGNRGARNVTLDVPFIHSVSHGGLTLSNRINNGAAATHTRASAWSATFGTMMLSTASASGSVTGNLLDGRIAEMLLYSRELSGTERSTVHRYLGAKYGITVS